MVREASQTDHMRSVSSDAGFVDKVRASLGWGEGGVEALPFGPGDVTAGAENELLAVVVGPRDQVDLARSLEESSYLRNLQRRAASGDASTRLVRAVENFLDDHRDAVWENSWVTFPVDLMSPYTRQVFAVDLFADKRARTGLRSDAHRFNVERNGVACARIPVSYLLKLALADAISAGQEPHPVVHDIGVDLLQYFLNDNTSPETLSFHTVSSTSATGVGCALADETLRRLLMVQFLTMYANEKFELRARGQETLVCMAPTTPVRQRRLNELVSDSFYRDLFMSPCLSGWDQGETKFQYMGLCHEVLSRSRLNTVAKLRESGILALDLMTLPTVSNTSLANNGTHITLGSRRLSALMANPGSGFDAAAEKSIGDLVVKIVEHFLPLFVGTYSAAPYRFDFRDFHPETVLGFLPHELDFTHLRMLWRRWKGKADLKCMGVPITPLGPRRLDRYLGAILGLRGDWVPDLRLIDYLVSPLSTDQSPALDGQIGNDERLKRDLAQMGVFDPRMSFYSLYRQRIFSRMGFCGFEGRHYSQFASLAVDLAAAADLQRLVTALAYHYVLSGKVTHADIPDTPEVESERRQIFFGAAIGIPTFFVQTRSPNRFLQRVINQTGRTRDSHRYSGFTRVYNEEYCRSLISIVEKDGAELVEALGAGALLQDVTARLGPTSERSAARIMLKGILHEAGASKPLNVSADTFNRAAERYYRDTQLKSFVREALELFAADIKALLEDRGASDGGGEIARSILRGEDPVTFLSAVQPTIREGKASQSVLVKLIRLLLVVVRRQRQQAGGGT